MTNRELAEKIGVSPSALSLVINHRSGVSEATRSMITQKLRDLGYDHLIKEIPASVLNSIAFVIYRPLGETLNVRSFYFELMEHVEKRARDLGYNMILYTMNPNLPMAEQIRGLKDTGCKGAVVMTTQMSEEDFKPFLDLPFPVVSLDNTFPDLKCCAVSPNDQMGIYQALEYLTSKGFKRIGYLKSAHPISHYGDRFNSYKELLELFGLQYSEEDVYELRLAENDSYEDMRGYLEKKPDLPEAFMSDDDIICYGVIRALREHGYRVPEDISLVGYNDRPTSSAIDPPLTTVNISRIEFSYIAVEELVKQIEPENRLSTRSRKISLGTEFVERESVRAEKDI